MYSWKTVMRYPKRHKDNPRPAKRSAREPGPVARHNRRRSLKKKVDQPEIIGEATVKDQPSADADYWESRAEKTRRQAGQYQNQAIRDHFMRIAAGYEELARMARAFMEKK
jgi:hypothetical protein